MDKVTFRVAYWSSESAEYPASELNVHSPDTRGWMTERFCEYPQDLVLDLGGRYRIRELQVLSHQSRIASRVRLYVGEGWDLAAAQFRLLGHFSLDSNAKSDHTVRAGGGGGDAVWGTAHSPYQARELKSVYLDHAASFLRLSVLGCHTNRHNLFNQVGIVAINVLGTPAAPVGEEAPLPAHRGGPTEHAPAPTPARPLRQQLALDAATAILLDALALAKREAVGDEDYEGASALKSAEAMARADAAEIARLHAEKKAAVAAEEFDDASRLREREESMRSDLEARITAHARVADALHRLRSASESRGASEAQRHQLPPHDHQDHNQHDQHSHPRGQYEPHQQHPYDSGQDGHDQHLHHDQQDHRDRDDQRDPAGIGQVPHYSHEPQSSFPDAAAATAALDVTAGRSPPKGAAGLPDDFAGRHAEEEKRMDSTDADERPLPAQQGKVAGQPPADPDPFVEPDNKEGDESAVRELEEALQGVPGVDVTTLPVPVPLTGQAAVDASALVAVFGDMLGRCLISKKSWHLREAGLKRVHALMEDRVSTGDTSILPSDPGAVISACGQAVTAGLRDRVPQVFFAATAAVGTWLSLVESEGTGMHDIRKAVDAATAAAVDRLGESNARFRKEASAALATIRHSRAAGPDVAVAALVAPMKNTRAWRPLVARFAEIRSVIDERGDEPLPHAGPRSAESILRFLIGANAFSHSKLDVRVQAKELAAALAQAAGGFGAIEGMLGGVSERAVEEIRELV